MPSHPTGRALRLLSLLQTHRLWRASELAGRFGVTERTIRRDVDRLRELGYRVDATTGPDGGYRLAAGSHLPPLVFDDDEAVAVVVGLRAAAGAAIAGIEDTSLQTLAKVELALPDRLRRRVSALNHSVVSLRPTPRTEDGVDPDTLSSLASACRRHEEVRFHYRRRDETDGDRLVEPHQLLSAAHLWYLVAWDVRRADWRTFRLDRMRDVRPAGPRFSPRPIPGGDAAAFLTSSVARVAAEIEAIVEVSAGSDLLGDALRSVDHDLVESDDDSCTLRIRARDLDALVMSTARLALRAPVRVLEPAPVADAVRDLSGRLARS